MSPIVVLRANAEVTVLRAAARKPYFSNLLTRGWTLTGAPTASARASAGAVASDKETYVCVVQASRPQVNRTPLGGSLKAFILSVEQMIGAR